jgi:hypothetical protein
MPDADASDDFAHVDGFDRRPRSMLFDGLALVRFDADMQERHRVALPLQQWLQGTDWRYCRARAVALPDGAVLVWICTPVFPGVRPRQLVVYTVRWHKDTCDLACGSSWSGVAPPGYATAADSALDYDRIDVVPHATGRLLVSWHPPSRPVGRPVRPCIRALC